VAKVLCPRSSRKHRGVLSAVAVAILNFCGTALWHEFSVIDDGVHLETAQLTHLMPLFAPCHMACIILYLPLHWCAICYSEVTTVRGRVQLWTARGFLRYTYTTHFVVMLSACVCIYVCLRVSLGERRMCGSPFVCFTCTHSPTYKHIHQWS
jgi:hypothetical protein